MSNSSSLDLKNCSHKSFAPQKISLTRYPPYKVRAIEDLNKN